MRILQIIQKKQYRGAEIFASQLSNHLIDQEHIVEMISIYEGDALLPFKENIINLSSTESNRYFDLPGWKKLNNIIKDFNPDVIQANAADTLKYAVFSKLIHNWEQPIFYRNASTSSFYIRSRFSKIINGFLLKKVDCIMSVSHASKNDLNALFPFTKDKTVVIPIGIEKSDGESFNLGDKRRNIIHVGSFTREKNHGDLLLIYQEIRKSNPNCHLHLFGEGPLRKQVEIQVMDMGIEAYVSFYEGVHNPLPFISGADVLVLPSIIEGLPAVLLEAMYCKTAVVAYDVGGISEIVSNSTGHLVKKDDLKGFVNAVNEILKNPTTSKVENANKLVTSEYMNSSIARKFISVYKESCL